VDVTFKRRDQVVKIEMTLAEAPAKEKP
jgi:hypothetical protein